jgi:phage gp29-like protein
MSKNTPRGLYLADGSIHRFAEANTTKGLTDHIASRDRSPDFTALGMYLPNPDPILKKLGKDAATYRDLRSTAPVGGAIRRRKAAVRSREWRLVDSVNGQTGARADQKASPRMMQIAQDTLAELDLDAILGEMLDAPLFGWVPMETMWAKVEGTLRPTALIAKPQEWFHFNSEGELRFRSRAAPMYGEELQPRKFLVPRQDASYVNPYGFADLSMCFWPTTFMRGGLKFWVTFSEKYGTPWVVGKQPRSAGTKETSDLLDQLEAMVQDAVAVVPDDSSVEIMQAGAKSDSAGAYEALLMFCRSEINIALLGQNQTTEASANKASASAGSDVEQSLSDADAKLCEGAINQLLRWMTDLNESEQAPAPRFELYEEEQVSEVQAKRDEAMSRSGVVFSAQYWEREYNLQPGDVASAGPGQVSNPAPPRAAPEGASPPQGGAAGDPAKPASRRPGKDTPGEGEGDADELPEYAEGQAQRDAIDDLVDAELANSWQQAMAPLIDPAQQLLDQAAAEGWTAQQLIDRLPDLLTQMDPAQLADSLTRATATARLAGAAGIPPAVE